MHILSLSRVFRTRGEALNPFTLLGRVWHGETSRSRQLFEGICDREAVPQQHGGCDDAAASNSSAAVNDNRLVTSEMLFHHMQKPAKSLDGIRHRPVRNRKGKKFDSAPAAHVGLLRKLKLSGLVRF